MRQEAKQILDDLKIDIDPDQTVGDLPVSKQQNGRDCKSFIHQRKDSDHG